MKLALILVLIVLTSLAFWGCPTRKYLPDPTPPVPQTIHYEELLRHRGQAPPVGPRQDQKRMLAHGILESSAAYLTVPL